MSTKTFLVELSDWHQITADIPEGATEQEVIEIVFPLALKEHCKMLALKPGLEILNNIKEGTIDWITILKQNEQAIKNEIKTAYARACGGTPTVESIVVVNKHGDPFIMRSLAVESSPLEINHLGFGIIRFQGFDPRKEADMTNFPQNTPYLTDKEKKDFILWCHKNNMPRHYGYLTQWNPYANHRWYRRYKEGYLNAHANDVAESVFEDAMLRARLYKRMSLRYSKSNCHH